jgi:hypothetical protein
MAQIAHEVSLQLDEIYRRFHFDPSIPGVNTRFVWSYIAATGGMIDAAAEPPQPSIVLGYPRLVFDAVSVISFHPAETFAPVSVRPPTLSRSLHPNRSRLPAPLCNSSKLTFTGEWY